LLAIKPDEKFHIHKYGCVNLLLIAKKKKPSAFAQSECVNLCWLLTLSCVKINPWNGVYPWSKRKGIL